MSSWVTQTQQQVPTPSGGNIHPPAVMHGHQQPPLEGGHSQPVPFNRPQHPQQFSVGQNQSTGANMAQKFPFGPKPAPDNVLTRQGQIQVRGDTPPLNGVQIPHQAAGPQPTRVFPVSSPGPSDASRAPQQQDPRFLPGNNWPPEGSVFHPHFHAGDKFPPLQKGNDIDDQSIPDPNMRALNTTEGPVYTQKDFAAIADISKKMLPKWDRKRSSWKQFFTD